MDDKYQKGQQIDNLHKCRACVSTGARGAWHTRNFRTSRLAPAEFEVLSSNRHSQAHFYRTDGTRSFKFLTQAFKWVTKLKFRSAS